MELPPKVVRLRMLGVVPGGILGGPLFATAIVNVEDAVSAVIVPTSLPEATTAFDPLELGTVNVQEQLGSCVGVLTCNRSLLLHRSLSHH